MRRIFGKFGIASATAIAIAIASITVSTPASARYGGGWHGGGWHGGGWHGGGWQGGGWRGGHRGWGWGGFGLGLGTGLLLGAAPYYGGYYGYRPYAYDYYGPPRCYISRRWVWDRYYGRRVLRRVRVCY
jgi:hypothetical protein